MVDKDDIQSKAADLIRKVLTVGVGTIFLTEQSLRALVKEFNLPSELLSGVLDSANKTKSEFFERFSKDVLSKVTEKMDPKDLIHEVLRKNEISMEIKLKFKEKKETSPVKS